MRSTSRVALTGRSGDLRPIVLCMLALIDLAPGSAAFTAGPLVIPWYGLGYVVGVAVLLVVARHEAARRGIQAHHVTDALILVAIPALIGGRLYHVIDQWAYYSQNLLAIVLPPYSGLGLYGGVAGAVLGIYLYTRRYAIPVWRALDIVAPGALFAQGIARWGNFFNQELYGPPTSAPWGIAIDCQHRVAEYSCATYPAAATGFEPLFFYESALDISGGLLALWVARRFPARLRDGDVASFWAIWYGSVRLFLETFRYGYNWTFFGVPMAMLIGAGLVVFGATTIVLRHQRPRRGVPALLQPAR